MLTLICGIPNAGKTTYSQKYGNVIHLDRFHEHIDRCNTMAGNVKADVCVEGVYNTAHDRKNLIKACSNQSPKICIWLKTSLDECLRREEQYRRRPAGMVRKHYEKFEAPTIDEGWDEIIIIED